MQMTKRRLGKGLGALINESSSGYDDEVKVEEIAIDSIEANPYQPRQEFEEEALAELAASISEKGVIQPITVRQTKAEKYQLVAGERRMRASQKAGLKKIPAIIRKYTDDEMIEIALIENLQREDLNPIEEAQAYRQMIDEFSLTQEEVAEKVGKSRSSVANTVRLLNLAPKAQMHVSRGTISMGHARTLLALKDHKKQIEACEHIIIQQLSVRETEEYINKLKNPLPKQKKEVNTNELSPEWQQLEKDFASYFTGKVKIKQRKNKNLLTIEIKNLDELKRIKEQMQIN